MSEAARPREEVDPESARERILAAGLELFAERGFDGARTRDIADRAGTNHGLIRYYFATKEALWKAAVDRAFMRLRARFADVWDTGDVEDRDRLEALVRRLVHFSADEPYFMRLMNDEGKRDTPRMRWLVRRHVRPIYEGLRVHVERAQRAGLVPPMPVPSFHYALVGAAGLAFSQGPECRALTGQDPSDPAFVEAHADAVVRLLLASPPSGRARSEAEPSEAQ